MLVEVHAHYQQQIEIAEQVDWVYDFALPPLVLHAFYTRDADAAAALDRRSGRATPSPCSTRTTASASSTSAPTPRTASRPGCSRRSRSTRSSRRSTSDSGGDSRLATGAAASNLDLYQVNCTFYDALGRDDDRYLLARAIQFFLPGIPQVYYVGLLAGRNDMELLARTTSAATSTATTTPRRDRAGPAAAGRPGPATAHSVPQHPPRLRRHVQRERRRSAPDHDLGPPQRARVLDASLDTKSATLTWTQHGDEQTAALNQLP